MILTATSDTHFGYDGSTQKTHRKRLTLLRSEMETIGSRLLIHCGDWATHRFRNIEASMKMFRDIFGSIPMLTVWGNHDAWDYDKDFKSLSELLDARRELLQAYQIHHPTFDGPLLIDDVAVVGFDGWYCLRKENSNDIKSAPRLGSTVDLRMAGACLDSFDFLQKLSEIDFESMLTSARSVKARKKVCVSHFPLYEDAPEPDLEDCTGNPKWLPFLRGHLDYFVCGHTHRAYDAEISGVRVLNTGSGLKRKHRFDYPKNDIQWIHIEIPDDPTS